MISADDAGGMRPELSFAPGGGAGLFVLEPDAEHGIAPVDADRR